MAELPVPDGPWRSHLLSRCRDESERLPTASEKALATCAELFRLREGSDAIMTLELSLVEDSRAGLVLLTLAQLYLMAGQGEPELLPSEGPAADVGHWERNQDRLLKRADELLHEAAGLRPDDGVIDFLLADVARARGDTTTAWRAFRAGRGKCSLSRSIEILREYQDLRLRAARVVEPVAPEYPAEAVRRRVTGEVELDLLIDPAGRVVQVVEVVDPDPDLTAAAAAALRRSVFEPARVGKYPIWSWLRVPTRFSLTE